MNIFDEKLSVIMPAYNEGESIFRNLLDTVEILEEFHNNFEIIAVNDGSGDDTETMMYKARATDSHIQVVSYVPNGGKGKAIKEGVLIAQGKYIAFLDADLDLSPRHLKDFLKKMDETDVEAVIGSKLHKDSLVNYPRRRKIMSVAYYIILVILFHLPVKDTQTGIKLFKADILRKIISKIKSTGYAYDIEILANVSKIGGVIAEMPIVLEYQRENHWGRIKFSDVMQVVKDTLKVYKAVNSK